MGLLLLIIMIELRDYQQQMYDKIIEAIIKNFKRLLVYAAMRSGKTVVFSYLAQRAFLKGKKCLIVTERIKLFEQTVNELNNFGVKPQLINADCKYIDLKSSCFLAMPISLKNRMELGIYKKWAESLDFIMIDEAHRTIADWMFDHPLFQDKIFLGFTGSPRRSGKQRQMCELYQKIIKGPTTRYLESIGKVNKLKIVTKKFDRDTLKVKHSPVSGDDFSTRSSFEAMDKPALYDGAIDAYKEYTPGTMAICYNVTIIHAIKTCIKFNDAGIPSKFITSAINRPKLKENPTPADITRYEEKKKDFDMYEKYYKIFSGDEHTILREWQLGKFLVLHNVDKYTFGFNEPRLVTTIVNRATLSLPLWVQMANRSTTICEGKPVSWLIDMAANVKHLGLPNENHEWSLVHEQKGGEGEAPVRECGKQKRPGVQPDPFTEYTPDKNGKPGCGALFPTAKNICPVCGYIFESEKELVKEELAIYDYENIDLEEDEKIKKFKELERIQEERGHQFGWVLNRIIADSGLEGLKEYAKYKDNKQSWVHLTAKRYKKQIERYNEKQELISKNTNT